MPTLRGFDEEFGQDAVAVPFRRGSLVRKQAAQIVTNKRSPVVHVSTEVPRPLGEAFEDIARANGITRDVPDSPRLLPLIKVCVLAMPPYVARPHSCTDKFVPRHLSDGFGQLPFGHGDPLANPIEWLFPYRIRMQGNSARLEVFPRNRKS
jgi:hypothetical protein